MIQADVTQSPFARGDRKPPQVEIVAVLIFMMSLLTFGGLLFWIFTHPALINSERTPGAVAWNFVSTLGVMRPLLLIAAGAGLMSLSVRLRRGEINAARWAKVIFNWLVVVAGVVLGYMTWLNLRIETLVTRDLFINLLPYLLIVAATIAIRQFIAASIKHFPGDEDIIAKQTRNAWNLLIPTIIVFLVIALNPLEQVFITSLTDERFASADEANFVGLENYNRLWSVRLDVVPCEQDESGACLTEIGPDGTEEIVYPRARRYFPDDSDYVQLRYRDFAEWNLFGRHLVWSARDTEFVDALITSVVYTVFAIFFQFTIGFAMAMVLAQRVRGIGILRVVMLVPMAIPTLIATQFWDVMLRPDASGLINNILLGAGFIGQPQDWLLDRSLQIPALVAVIVWKETPITALLLLPGLLAIPREVYQAAAIDGANRWQRFWQITMPMMRPTIGVTLVLRTMLFLRVFDLFWILVGRTRLVLATYSFEALIQRQQLGYSSAISVTIFIVTIFFTVAYMRTLRIDEA